MCIPVALFTREFAGRDLQFLPPNWSFKRMHIEFANTSQFARSEHSYSNSSE